MHWTLQRRSATNRSEVQSSAVKLMSMLSDEVLAGLRTLDLVGFVVTQADATPAIARSDIAKNGATKSGMSKAGISKVGISKQGIQMAGIARTR